nr:hypothetical protein [Delftia acidovorans]
MTERAQKAMADLESFFQQFRFGGPQVRQSLLPRLGLLRSEITSVAGADSYVMQKLGSLEESCRRLARLRQPKGFSDSDEISRGLGDVSVIRDWLVRLGALPDPFPKE